MKKINIGGKELPCRITLGAMLRYKREKGEDVSELDAKDVEGLAFFLYCCIVSACKADGVDWNESFEDLCDKIDLNDVNGFYEGMDDGSKKK